MNTFELIEFIVFLGASILYIYHLMTNKKFVPNPIGFGIWMIADGIHLFTYLDFSSFWVGPVIMFSGATTIVVIGIIRTIKNKKIGIENKNNINWIDYIVVGTVLISISILLFSHNSVLSNMAIQITLALGFIPIIKDLIVKKTIEPIFQWILFFVGFVVVLIHTSYEYQRWEELIYPIVGVVGDFIVIILSVYNWLIKTIE